jgi:hypothetical protein
MDWKKKKDFLKTLKIINYLLIKICMFLQKGTYEKKILRGDKKRDQIC